MALFLFSFAILCSYIFFCDRLVTSVNGRGSTNPYFLGNVAINCGSIGNSSALDGREWIGEAQLLQPKGKSKPSAAAHNSLSADPVPYMTARASATQFVYNFQVSPGQKFLRLHFYPSSYRGFEKFEDFFTVKAGPFTLLRNCRASLAADDLGVTYIVKEFCLTIEENKNLHIAFSASQGRKMRNSYAFVNGIEIISMPTGLYYTPDGNLGALIVGQNHGFYYIDNRTALEMVQRLNIGGSSILPVEDFGMFRRWSEDANYFLESRFQQVNPWIHEIKYTKMPIFVAPLKIYLTSWKTRKGLGADEVHNFTWKIPVDLGFGYLIRLHFGDFVLGMTGNGRREFSVFINHQIAETKADVIRWSDGSGIPVYRDYVVMMKGDKEEGKVNLFIVLQSQDELVVGLLNGLEVFKLSNPDNNLATPNAVFPKQASTSWTAKIKNFLLAFGRSNVTVTGFTILIIVANAIVYKLRQIYEENYHGEEVTQASSTEPSCRFFSIAEIKSATQNFSDDFVIGHGGFGKVYKGFISGGSQIVAIKRLKSNSKQGAHEFWTEIETLSKLRHIHLVSLIGYCNECQEMILVYEYMSRGTLADNLYKNVRNGKDDIHLTWEQRLTICIAAARGLDYLHTGSEHGVIHRDVKDTNILLDENFVAKISDFGLSKLEKTSQSKSYVSTKVKGTFGYLDPDYFMTHKLTRKTDVYAFGVVLLVVLCGKPAVYTRIPGETRCLLSNFRECITKGELNEILDPSLQGQITSESLKEFVKTVENCLQHVPKNRPTTAQLVASLEYALEQQQSTKFSLSMEAIALGQPSEHGILQSSQFNLFSVSPIPEESVIFCLDEVITNKAIPNAELQTREVLQSREKDHPPVQKSFWGWRWEALKNKGKPTQKKDFISPDEPQDLVSPKIYHFSRAEIREATDNFNFDRAILYDESRRMYAGFVKKFPAQVAIYYFKIELYSEEVLELCNEIEKVSQLRHPILQLMIGYYCSENELFMVYPFTGNGTLRQILYDNRKVNLKWHLWLQTFIGIARGLEYLHDGNGQITAHGDLRPENIMLDENWTPKLLNFGKISWSSWEYLPPGVDILGQKITEKCDVYSFGLILLEVLCGRGPGKFNPILVDNEMYLPRWIKKGIKTKTLDQAIDSILKGQIAGACLAEFLKIAFSCLLDRAEERPAMRSVVARLEFALLLQEQAAEQSDNGFDLVDIYQGISDLAADEWSEFWNWGNQIDELEATSKGKRVS